MVSENSKLSSIDKMAIISPTQNFFHIPESLPINSPKSLDKLTF